jgi:drug/metabolite transporter (DMT)-like permease
VAFFFNQCKKKERIVSVLLGYLVVIAIWSTTPLAIKWSGEGSGFLFGVSSRMAIGLFVCVVILTVLRKWLPFDHRARKTYLAGSLAVYAAMLSVYWGAQFIPSGLVSVVFGLTPVITGIFAAFWLGERTITPVKMFGLLLGISGLVLIFDIGLNLGVDAAYGIAGVFTAVVFHSLSTVWVKRIASNISVISMTTGSLAFSVPLFLLTWWVFDGAVPDVVPARTGFSIIYLGIVGSVIGYLMFFYVLKNSTATQVGLIPLVTPVLALFLGHVLNGEAITLNIWLGTMLVMLGLAVFQWGSLLIRRMKTIEQVDNRIDYEEV